MVEEALAGGLEAPAQPGRGGNVGVSLLQKYYVVVLEKAAQEGATAGPRGRSPREKGKRIPGYG